MAIARTTATLSLAATLILMGACGSDVGVSETSKCDARAQGGEDSVDEPYDADGDGYFDGHNPDCAGTYDSGRLDCDDTNAEINPGMAEVGCDGVDNDCDDGTFDSLDADGDGFAACDDCDDSDAGVHPDAAEVACDGVDNDCDDSTEDALDADSDGYDQCSDCEDDDSDVSPGVAEVACNGVDDDCDDATPDASDLDGDGVDACDDCDDNDAAVSPELDEVCEDELDNDCDGDVDEDCDYDYTDVWTLDSNISYSCAYGLVSYTVSTLRITDAQPAMSASAGRSQPGTMSGTLSEDGVFEVSNTISGSCTEVYTLAGEFTDRNTLEATFTAEFIGGASQCSFYGSDVCADQAHSVTAYR